MGSALLYHGPGAEGAAHDAAQKFGRVIPFGEPGAVLKKDAARELVSLLNQTPVGSRPWSVVVGPIDEVRPDTADILLKTLEDPNPVGVRPFLWARDLGSVLPTIRSRCLLEFVPGEDERVLLQRPQAEQLLSLYIQKNWTDLVSELKDIKGEEEFVLLALVDVLQERLGDPSVQGDLLALWRSLRELFQRREAPLTPARVFSVFLCQIGVP